MNVLVTGANGQLAKTIKTLFNNNTDNILFDFKTKDDLDISSKFQVFSHFDKTKYNFCVNCAAYTKVDQAENEPQAADLINNEGTENLVQACKKNNVCLIHISTDYVFKGISKTPYKETDSPSPVNQYGISKLKGEKQVSSYLEKHYIIRTAWLYSSFSGNFLSFILDKISKNQELNIVDSQKGTPTSCDELSRFIYYFIKNNNIKYGTYHFSCLGETSWYGFAKEIASYFPKYSLNLLKPLDSFPSLAKRPNYSVFSLEKTKRIYPNLKTWKKALQEVLKQIDTLHL